MTEQRTAIVTGAGTGIGKSVATALLKAGWNTVFCGRRKSVLDAAVAEAGSTDAKALAVACDISKAGEVDDLFETVAAAFGRVDLLFNNAGMGYKSTPIDEIPVEVWNDIVGV
ncbi:MAG: SDR family oxidoreductase, partial [Mesorhizobium sp.]